MSCLDVVFNSEICPTDATPTTGEWLTDHTHVPLQGVHTHTKFVSDVYSCQNIMYSEIPSQVTCIPLCSYVADVCTYIPTVLCDLISFTHSWMEEMYLDFPTHVNLCMFE